MTKGYLEPAIYNKSNNELLQEVRPHSKAERILNPLPKQRYAALKRSQRTIALRHKDADVKRLRQRCFQTLCRADCCIFPNEDWV